MSCLLRFLLCSIACWGILTEGVVATGLAATSRDNEAYFNQIERRIMARWKVPPGSDELKVTLRFNLARNGAVAFVHVEMSSGNPSFDDSAVQAVRRASPFPPPPKSFPTGDLRMVLDPTRPKSSSSVPKTHPNHDT